MPPFCLLLALLTLIGAALGQFIRVVRASEKTFLGETQDDGPQTRASRLLEEGRLLVVKEGTSESLEKAIKKFEEALSIWREIGGRREQAITLSDIGKAYDLLGEKQKALDQYVLALPILREVGDARGEAKTLNNIGLIYDALGEKRKALEFYNRSLPILSEAKDNATEGITLVNIGLAYAALGDKQKALTYYLRALTILHEAGDQASEAVTLNNLGFLYDSLGEKQKALAYYDQVLPILRATGDKRVEAVTLTNIGYVYDSLDDKQKALEYYKQALPVLRASGDRFKEATTIHNIGLVYDSMGQSKTALEYLNQALTLKQTILDRPGEAFALGDLGKLYDELGQAQKAMSYLSASLRLSREVEDRSVEASTLRRIAVVEEKLGNLAEARVKMEAALAVIEDLRTRITSQDLRASYFASVHKHFETYISLLMHMHRKEPLKGYDALALKASERARARSMLEMLAEAKADVREGVAPALVDRMNHLQQRLRDAAEKQTRLVSERKPAQEVMRLRQEVDVLLGEYQQAEAEIRTASPRYAALTQPVPLGVREIQQQALDKDSLLLEFSLGEKKSFIWVVSPTTMRSYELAPRAEIENAARLVNSLLTARNREVKFETPQERAERVEKADRDYFSAASQLSRLLLDPIATQLGKKRLLIVGDGVLDYVAFAALPSAGNQTTDKYQPLMVDHEVVSLPSASTLALLRQEMAGRVPADKMLAVIADPVFGRDDPRVNPNVSDKNAVTRGTFGAIDSSFSPDFEQASSVSQDEMPQTGTSIQRLPFTRLEADAILSLVPPGESKKAVDFEANRELAINPELGKYRYVHFATHGILNSQHPELSGIVLSLVNREGKDEDGFLWAHEIFNLRLPVEMVVLSGCRTGLGKDIRGEGIVGLTRGFMYAGAKRVVVSLWDISDEASAELMAQFYKGMLGSQRLGPAAALRSAQIAIWKTQRWRTPYYWAAFVIQGEAN